MSDTQSRAGICAEISQLLENMPEMRVGQILATVGEICADMHVRGLWEATDTELLESFWKFRQDLDKSGIQVTHKEELDRQ